MLVTMQLHNLSGSFPTCVQGSSTEARGMMLVPQKPYMALGTLRQQLLYPVFDAAIISEALLDNEDTFSKSGLLDFPIESHSASAEDSSTNGDGAGGKNGKDSKEGENGVTADSSEVKAEANCNGTGNGKGKRSEQVPALPDEVLLQHLEAVCTVSCCLVTDMRVLSCRK